MEFDQRHFGLASYNAFWALVYLAPIVAAGWFYAHDGAELISWGLMLASFLGLAYCFFGFYWNLKHVDELFTQRVRLIFCPGRIIRRQRSLLNREEMIFDHDHILEVHHARPQRGQDNDRYLYLKYHLPPAETDSSESLPGRPPLNPSEPADGKGKDVIYPDLLYDLGRFGICAWAAGLIRKALAPRSVVFVDRSALEAERMTQADTGADNL